MKFVLYSDIHLEFGKFREWHRSDRQDTVLLLAGDIGVGKLARQEIEKLAKSYMYVVLVLGNHEFYGREMSKLMEEWDEVCRNLPNVFLLHNSSVLLTDDNQDCVLVYGGTMWTSLNNQDWSMMYRVSRSMSDCRLIKHEPNDIGSESQWGNSGLFTPDHWVQEHAKFKDWFLREYAALDHETIPKRVVVTHHAPSSVCVKHEDLFTPAYVEPLLDVMARDPNTILPNVWCHGHLHDTVDEQVDTCRVLSNPRGYVGVKRNRDFIPQGLQFEV